MITCPSGLSCSPISPAYPASLLCSAVPSPFPPAHPSDLSSSLSCSPVLQPILLTCPPAYPAHLSSGLSCSPVPLAYLVRLSSGLSCSPVLRPILLTCPPAYPAHLSLRPILLSCPASLSCSPLQPAYPDHITTFPALILEYQRCGTEIIYCGSGSDFGGFGFGSIQTTVCLAVFQWFFLQGDFWSFFTKIIVQNLAFQCQKQHYFPERWPLIFDFLTFLKFPIPIGQKVTVPAVPVTQPCKELTQSS